MELSKKLKTLRKKKELSQAELAEALCVSRQAVSGWEVGASSPSMESLRQLSRLYGVPLGYLLDDGLDEPEEPAKAPEAPAEAARKGAPETKALRLLVAALLTAVVVLAGILLFGGRQESPDIFWTGEMDGEEVERNPEGDFDIEWERGIWTGQLQPLKTGSREWLREPEETVVFSADCGTIEKR